jgi:prepilin-type processing-associated H-X9-DG protein
MSPRFRLRDLLIGAGIAVFVVWLMLFGMRRARENVSRVGCENNLRQLGTLAQMYCNSVGFYPTEVKNEKLGPSGSFFYDVATFAPYPDRDPAAPDPRREYLCPARRGIESSPRTDYGYGANSPFGISVLAAPTPLTRSAIESADGMTFTLLLSHKGVRPSQYDGSGPNDLAWYDKSIPNSRDPLSLNRDSDDLEMWKLLGSPHGDGVPSLFVDGHVEFLPYVGSEVHINNVPVMAARWAYNDGNR